MQQQMALLIPPIPPLGNQALKIQEPKPFNMIRLKYRSYIIQLHLIFNSDPTCYSTELSKVAYVASYLISLAKDWFQLHIYSKTGVVDFLSFANFIQSIQAAFDDHDTKITTKRKLKAFKQGPRDCSTYCTEFTTLIIEIGRLYKIFIFLVRFILRDLKGPCISYNPAGGLQQFCVTQHKNRQLSAGPR